MKRRPESTLVTGAALSRDEEFKSRKRRYVVTMSMRIVLLILAALLAKWNLWACLIVAGVSVVLPWVAVVMANDGPPKNSKKYRAMHTLPADRQLESSGDADHSPKIINGDANVAPVSKEDQ